QALGRLLRLRGGHGRGGEVPPQRGARRAATWHGRGRDGESGSLDRLDEQPDEPLRRLALGDVALEVAVLRLCVGVLGRILLRWRWRWRWRRQLRRALNLRSWPACPAVTFPDVARRTSRQGLSHRSGRRHGTRRRHRLVPRRLPDGDTWPLRFR